MCELAESHERRPDWLACTAFALVLGLAMLTVLSAFDVNRRNQPTDEELTSNFFSHEARFDELVQMLGTDHQARFATNAARFRMYRGLLRQVSVTALRYFPDSGKLVLVPDGAGNLQRPSKSYLYLPRVQSQSLADYPEYMWRGPGMYILTGDRPLSGSWFVHHETTIEIAVSPY